MTSNAPLNVLILGKEGSGKSSLGNALLGQREFDVSSGMFSATNRFCLASSRCSDGKFHLTIVDSPDLTSDGSGSPGEARKSLEDAFKLCPTAEFHMIALTVRLDVRFTDEYRQSLSCIADALGTTLLTRVGVVVFTHGDCIGNDEANLDQLVANFRGGEGATSIIGSVIDRCGGRFCLIDASRACNQGVQRSQTQRLLQFADAIRLHPVRYSDIADATGAWSYRRTWCILLMAGIGLAVVAVAAVFWREGRSAVSGRAAEHPANY